MEAEDGQFIDNVLRHQRKGMAEKDTRKIFFWSTKCKYFYCYLTLSILWYYNFLFNHFFLFVVSSVALKKVVDYNNKLVEDIRHMKIASQEEVMVISLGSSIIVNLLQGFRFLLLLSKFLLSTFNTYKLLFFFIAPDWRPCWLIMATLLNRNMVWNKVKVSGTL